MSTEPSASDLSVSWHDPTRVDPPPGWSEFIAAHDLHPVWDWSIVHAYTTASRVKVVTATVHDGQRIRALATGRFPGPRTRRAGTPLAGVVDLDCLASSALPGLALSDPGDPELLAEVVAALRTALRRRFGRRVRGMMLRQVGEDWLPVALRWPAVVRQGGPIAVLRNRFASFDDYLASLSRGRRKSLRQLTRNLDADPDLRVSYTPRGDEPAPLTADQVCDLVNRVVDRHHHRWWLRKRYMRLELARAKLAHPRVGRLTYHDRAGRLLAYATIWDHPTMPVLGAWGAPSVAEGGRKGLWFHCESVLVRWCIDSGKAGMIAGQGNAEDKRRLGYQLQPQWTVLLPQ